VKELQRSHW